MSEYEKIVISAERYALGRVTYIVDITVNYILQEIGRRIKMSYGKNIGTLLVSIIKAEKKKNCDMCKYKKTMRCPNSSLCYSTKDKPYFKSKLDKEE